MYTGQNSALSVLFLFFLDGEQVVIENGTFSWSAEGPPCLKRYYSFDRERLHNMCTIYIYIQYVIYTILWQCNGTIPFFVQD